MTAFVGRDGIPHPANIPTGPEIEGCENISGRKEGTQQDQLITRFLTVAVTHLPRLSSAGFLPFFCREAPAVNGGLLQAVVVGGGLQPSPSLPPLERITSHRIALRRIHLVPFHPISFLATDSDRPTKLGLDSC